MLRFVEPCFADAGQETATFFDISYFFHSFQPKSVFHSSAMFFYMLCGNISYSSLTLFSVYEGPGCVNACCIMCVADMIA